MVKRYTDKTTILFENDNLTPLDIYSAGKDKHIFFTSMRIRQAVLFIFRGEPVQKGQNDNKFCVVLLQNFLAAFLRKKIFVT